MNKEFWDIKAKRYPRPFEPENLRSYRDLLERISKFGVSFAGKKVIDIGCGTGNYGLLIAQDASEVFCLDFSKNMIDALADEVASRNIKNVRWAQSSFSDFDISGIKKYFDISFASMTPAIKTREDVLKMEELAAQTCIFVGWAGRRENKLADEILHAHGIAPYFYLPKGFIEVREILKARKLTFEDEAFESTWKWSGSIEEAIDEFSVRIKLVGKQPDERLIRSILISKFPSGKVEMTTFATLGIIIWKP